MSVKPATYKLSENPFMVKCLDISTGHLTEKDESLLEEASKGSSVGGNPVVANKYEEGYYVYCSDEDGIRDVDSGEGEYGYLSYGYSTQFMAILKRAKELGCKYVQFDCDGIFYEDLETYEW